MKKFIFALSLVFAGLVHAETESIIFPRVSYFGNRVQVDVWNSTDRYVYCSGMIYVQTNTANHETIFYNESIAPRFNSYRSFYIRNFNERVVHATNSIYCR